MKLNTLTKLMKWFSAISLACAATSLVGVPVDIDYNGSLADETGALLDGEYQMQFAIALEDGSVVYWNNEEGSAATGLPTTTVPVTVTAGVFSTVLEGVDSDVLANADLYLHVWVGDTAETLEALGAAPINSVPYAVRAGGVAAEDIDGGFDGLLPEGGIPAEALGTVLIDVPFIDADGDGIPDDPSVDGSRRVSMESILQSISDNSKLAFENVNPENTAYEVRLDVDQEVGSIVGWEGGNGGTSGNAEFKDPFPIGQVYEYNGGLMPQDIAILDVTTGDEITGEAGNPIPGLTFVFLDEDVERTSPGAGPPPSRRDGLEEPRMVVRGTPTEVGDYVVRVRATNAWGMDFVQDYTVIVRDIDIDSEVYMERTDFLGGDSSWTTDSFGGVDNGDNIAALGGDPVRAVFETDEPLTDNITVRWTYPDPASLNPSDTLTVDIPGDTGRMFYVASESGDDSGAAPSTGVQFLDEDPRVNGGRSHIGEYSAQILLDWGQGVDIGSATIITINNGFDWPDAANTLMYIAGPDVDIPGGPGYVAPPATPVQMFDVFDNSAADIFGTKNYTGQLYGMTPSGDQGAPIGNGLTDWHLRGVITGGDVQKGLVGTNPFNVVNSGEYIRGTMTNEWMQQKRIEDINGNAQEVSLGVVETIVTDGVLDPTVDLAISGFGPISGDGWPLSDGDGVISDDVEERAPYYFPEDGGNLTFKNGGVPARLFDNDDPLNPISVNRDNALLQGVGDKQVTYLQYSSNGFIDSVNPVAAIVEVGSNVNIVNDLVDVSTQVAGYSIQVGGDFGTTNGKDTDLLKPAEGNDGSRSIIWGVNDLAYIWSSPSDSDFVVESLNGNVATIAGENLVNTVTDDDDEADVEIVLNLDSGFSNEETSTEIRVISDIVVWDFNIQRIDLLAPMNNFAFYDLGFPSSITENKTIAPGDDLLITLEAYVRPPLYTSLASDAGGVTDYTRDLNATFYLVPFQTNIPVELTANITKTEDDLGGPGLIVDDDNNHVQPDIENRMLTRWEVILENPLQDLATTNVATGYIFAVITSEDADGNLLNTVSTLVGHPQEIAANNHADRDQDTEGYGAGAVAPSGDEVNTIGPDFTLDARVKMPLDPVAGDMVITVDPNEPPFPLVP